MGFLSRLKQFHHVCIQCHDMPDSDTVGAAFGVCRYLRSAGVDAEIVYGGREEISMSSLKQLIRHCEIPVRHVEKLPETELLLVVDAQYGGGNVTKFEAPVVAMIDHHPQIVEPGGWTVVRPEYQSCSTIVWEMLTEEGYPVFDDPRLCTALLYGLYIDTSFFAGLFGKSDMRMKQALYDKREPFFDYIIKCNMSVAELMLATDAMHNHILDFETRCAVIPVMKGNQALLGIIGDFMIQIDIVDVTVTYVRVDDRYRFSIRSCRKECPADVFARQISDGTGSGGGHTDKAAGVVFISRMEAVNGKQDFGEFILRVYRRIREETAGNILG